MCIKIKLFSLDISHCYLTWTVCMMGRTLLATSHIFRELLSVWFSVLYCMLLRTIF